MADSIEQLLQDITTAITMADGPSIQARILAIVTANTAQINRLLEIVSDQTPLLVEILTFLRGLPPPLDTRAVSAQVLVPRTFDPLTKKEILMPQNVANDVITGFVVEFDNLGGQPVPPPSGGAVSLTLVDDTGAPSTLGSVAVGWPDGSGTDGSKFMVTPASGLPTGNAHVHYDDVVAANTPNDISFVFDITFTNDTAAKSAHVDTTKTQTFPLTPPAPPPPPGP